MPSSTLDDLIARYGTELVEGHYGVAVYEALEGALQTEGVAEAMSPVSQSVKACLDVGAFEVLLVGGGIDGLARYSATTVLDVACQLGMEAVGAAAELVPVVGDVFKFLLFGLGDMLEAQARAELIAERKKRQAKCMQEQQNWGAWGTGDYGQIVPSDLFVQARRQPDKSWWHHGPRTPYIGQMLQLMTEYQWPAWAYLYPMQARKDVTPKAALTDLARSFGYRDDEHALRMFEAVGQGTTPGPYDQGYGFPEITRLRPVFQKLRSAIAAQHGQARALSGLPPGDGGVALWPLYQDLMWQVLRRGKAPWCDAIHPMCYRPYPPGEYFTGELVAALPEHIARIVFGGEQCQHDPETGVKVCPSRPPLLWWIERLRSTFDFRIPYSPAEGLCGFCQGSSHDAVKAIYRMCDDWQYHVDPVYAQDIEAVAKSAQAASEYVRERLRQLGVDAVGGLDPGQAGKEGLRQGLERLHQGGLVSGEAAAETMGAVEQGADRTRAAVILGLAAAGIGGAVWWATR